MGLNSGAWAMNLSWSAFRAFVQGGSRDPVDQQNADSQVAATRVVPTRRGPAVQQGSKPEPWSSGVRGIRPRCG
jgi:hypothetical protein